jgi:hypothetical protein
MMGPGTSGYNRPVALRQVFADQAVTPTEKVIAETHYSVHDMAAHSAELMAFEREVKAQKTISIPPTSRRCSCFSTATAIETARTAIAGPESLASERETLQ